MNRVLPSIKKILKDRRFLRRWRYFVTFLASVCVFVTTYNLILPAISVEKDNAENVSGLYLEDAEGIDDDQNTLAEPDLDDMVTDAPIVQTQEAADKDQKESSDLIELSASGDAYEIFVTCENKTGIPADAYLEVQEITQDSGAYDSGKITTYDEYIDNTLDALGLEAELISYVRVFDISIVKDGEKIQPAEGGSVGVRIELEDSSSDCLNVVHFPDDSEEGEQVLSSTEYSENGAVVEFETDSFSVYSIVDAPEPVTVYQPVNTLADIVEDQGYYLAIARSGTNYMTSTRFLNGATYELTGVTNRAEGENWFFERPEEGKVNIYYLDSDGTKM